jgi:hypothetical protein
VVAEAAAVAAAEVLPAATELAAEAVALAVARAAAAAVVAPAEEAEAAALLVMVAMARAMAASRSAMDVPVAAEACTAPQHVQSVHWPRQASQQQLSVVATLA